MLRFSPILIVAALAACAPDAVPTIASGVTLTKSREVLVKGVEGGRQPYIEKRSYPVTCAADNQGGTPDQRADQMMAQAARVLGQVETPLIGQQYQRSRDMREINRYGTPHYRCSVGAFTPAS